MKKPRVYIAGPMRGIPFFNFPAFDEARDELNLLGYEAVSPADLDRKLYGFEALDLPADSDWWRHPLPIDYAEVLQTDCNVVKTCGALLTLPGWANSEGARRERNMAFEAGIGVYDSIDDLLHDLPTADSHSDPVAGTSAGLKPTNPKDMIGSDKLPLHLWPATATAMGCLGLLDGMLKYGRTNWRVAGVRASIYIDACKRHLDLWFEGEEHAGDSGVPHLGHALACIAILVDAAAAGKLNDDRNIAGGYAELMTRLTTHVKRLKELYKDKHPRHYTIADNKKETE